MTDQLDELTKRGQDLYENGVNKVLAGFQLIEELLKTYIEAHYEFVRAFLGDRLYFAFSRSDFQDAALGRLTEIFSKLCPNKGLVADLRAVKRRRDEIAHRALLKLYEHGISPSEYSKLIDELTSDMQRNLDLMSVIRDEMAKLGK
jgi:uncharacterized protein YbcC (UPF0753/DUF2309 family)